MAQAIIGLSLDARAWDQSVRTARRRIDFLRRRAFREGSRRSMVKALTSESLPILRALVPNRKGFLRRSLNIRARANLTTDVVTGALGVSKKKRFGKVRPASYLHLVDLGHVKRRQKSAKKGAGQRLGFVKGANSIGFTQDVTRPEVLRRYRKLLAKEVEIAARKVATGRR